MRRVNVLQCALLFTTLLCAGMGFAVEADARIDPLQQLMQSLLHKSDKIRAAEYELQKAEYDLKESQGDWLPKLELTMTQGSERQNKPNTDDSSLNFNEQDLKLTQLLYDFGKTEALVNSSEIDLLKARKGLNKTESSQILQGVTIYLELFRAEKKLQYARDSEENIMTQTGMEESLVKLGGGLPTDVLQTKSQLAGARAARARAEGEMQNARNSFWLLFRLKPQPFSEYLYPNIPEGSLPKNVDEAIALAMEDNLDIQLSKLDLESAFEKMQEKRSAMFPELKFIGDYKHKEDVGGSVGVKDEAIYKIELSYPIFNGLKDQSAHQASLKVVDSAQFKLNDLKREVELNVRKAWQHLRTQQDNAMFLENQANIAGEFLADARKERKLGNRSLLDVLSGETNHVNAISAALSAKVDADLAVYQLFDVMGLLRSEMIYSGER